MENRIKQILDIKDKLTEIKVKDAVMKTNLSLGRKFLELAEKQLKQKTKLEEELSLEFETTGLKKEDIH